MAKEAKKKQDWEVKKSPEVEAIADALIERGLHPTLVKASILYGFTLRDAGKIVGTARKVDRKIATLFGNRADFAVIISYSWWEHATEEQRLAAVDHELMHCDLTDGKAKIKKHDFEGFTAELERYGAWREPLHDAQAALQLNLDLPETGGVYQIGQQRVAASAGAVPATQ
jgi:hypothetical protein